MKTFLVSVLVVIVAHNAYCAMTDAQMKSAAKLLRNVCQPKTKISSAQIDAMHNGDFTKSKEVLSYAECVLRTAQVAKDGKLNYEFLKSQASNLPEGMAEPALVSSDHCKDSMKNSDKFEAALEFYKCFYEDNPTNFFLP